MWLIKPTHTNRGIGVNVFSEISTLKDLLREHAACKDYKIWKNISGLDSYIGNQNVASTATKNLRKSESKKKLNDYCKARMIKLSLDGSLIDDALDTNMKNNKLDGFNTHYHFFDADVDADNEINEKDISLT